MGKYRRVEFYKNYFEDFYSTLPAKVQEKFVWTLELLEDIDRIPEKYFKHLDDGIYEIRVKIGSNVYRVFSFFDQGKLIIAVNGFQKKTRKTPVSELIKAKKIREEYESEK